MMRTRFTAFAPTPSAHSARDEKTYRATQRTYRALVTHQVVFQDVKKVLGVNSPLGPNFNMDHTRGALMAASRIEHTFMMTLDHVGDLEAMVKDVP